MGKSRHPSMFAVNVNICKGTTGLGGCVSSGYYCLDGMICQTSQKVCLKGTKGLGESFESVIPTRVTRLGEFSPFGQYFILGIKKIP
jgi:hypothetical protein